MILLAVDTSGRRGSVGLIQAETTGQCTLLEEASLAGGVFSAQLLPEIAGTLNTRDIRKEQLEAFVAVSGPGSFTGLRVGLAAIKALAAVLEKPIAAVSLLEAISVASGLEGSVIALMDAGRGELYAGKYEVSNSSALKLWEQLWTREQLLQGVENSTLIATDMILAESLRAHGLDVLLVGPPSIEAVAQLGWKKILSGGAVSVEELDASYIRRAVPEMSAGVTR